MTGSEEAEPKNNLVGELDNDFSKELSSFYIGSGIASSLLIFAYGMEGSAVFKPMLRGSFSIIVLFLVLRVRTLSRWVRQRKFIPELSGGLAALALTAGIVLPKQQFTVLSGAFLFGVVFLEIAAGEIRRLTWWVFVVVAWIIAAIGMYGIVSTTVMRNSVPYSLLEHPGGVSLGYIFLLTISTLLGLGEEQKLKQLYS